MKYLKNKGIVLLESLLSVTLFALILTIFTGILISGQEGSRIAGDQYRAIMLARQGIEATRNIKDRDFDLLTNGNHGLVKNSVWQFSGTSDQNGKFTRVITISTVDEDIKKIVSKITWNKNLQRAGTITHTTYLSKWNVEVVDDLPAGL